jgi:hypothetical protein
MSFLAILFSLTLANGGGPDMRELPALKGAGEDPCGAANLQHLVGEPLPSAEALAALEGPRRVRVVQPGDMLTMDHIPGRLNVELDAAGIVRNLRCG